MKNYNRAPDPAETSPSAHAPLPVRPKAGKPSRRSLRVVAGLGVGMTVLGLVLANLDLSGDESATSKPPATTTGPMPAMTVTLARAAHADWDSTLEAFGAVEAWQEAVLGAQTAGLRLLEVRAEVGDTVKRGQVLARFDAAMLRAGQAELRAGLAQAEAAARQAVANRDRSRLLKDSGGISQQEMLQYETQADTSAAQVSMVRAQLASKDVQLDYAELRAPDDGTISARSATVGAVAGSGQELFRLIRQGRLEWRGELTASQLARIAPGQRVLLRLPDGSAASARLRQSAPRLDAQSRLATVYADIDPGSRARAGMYAAGQVVLERRPAVTVPAASVVIRDGRSYVFKLRSDGHQTVVAQLAQVGRRQGRLVEILDSVTEGDQVVVQGAGFLKDGDSVRVVDAVTAAAPASAAADPAAPPSTRLSKKG